MSVKQFAIIGLGRFGSALCEELYRQQAEILVIDINEDRVKKMADFSVQAIVADASDEEVLKEIDLQAYDLVFVAIGDNIHASILTTLILKEYGVKNVWVKADDRFHERILRKIGADRIVLPQKEMGIQIAQTMIDDRIHGSMSLGGHMIITEFCITNKNTVLRLSDIELITQEKVQVLGIKRGRALLSPIAHNMEIKQSDVLILGGDRHHIDSILKQL